MRQQQQISAAKAAAATHAAMPLLFVLLWSTGFIGSRVGVPYAEPLTFLLLRFLLAGSLLAVIALAARAPWPSGRALVDAAVTGLLVQALYLGGVFEAVFHGMAAGVTALIVSLQPLITAALAAPLLNERVTARQWTGLALGLSGTALVLWDRLDGGIGDGWAVVFAVAALAGITAGTIYQKRFGSGTDLRTGGAVQYGVCAALLLAIAPFCETMIITWSPPFILALAWLTLALSVGAISIYFALIRRGSAARVSSLMYLVPVVTSVMAWALLGEPLTLLALLGMAVVAVGVVLVNR